MFRILCQGIIKDCLRIEFELLNVFFRKIKFMLNFLFFQFWFSKWSPALNSLEFFRFGDFYFNQSSWDASAMLTLTAASGSKNATIHSQQLWEKRIFSFLLYRLFSCSCTSLAIFDSVKGIILNKTKFNFCLLLW